MPAFRVTVYVDRTDAAEFIEFCEAALELVAPAVTHYQTGSMKRPATVSDKARGLVRSWFRRPRDFHTDWALFKDADIEVAAGSSLEITCNHYINREISAAEQEIRRQRLRVLYEERGFKTFTAVSKIELTVGRNLSRHDPITLRDWLLARPLLAQTAFASGHCGWGLNDCKGVIDRDVKQKAFGGLAYAVTRHPGLDFSQVGGLDAINRYDRRTRDLVPHIVRVNWLTLVSDRALAAIGDPLEVIAELTRRPDVKTWGLDHGVMVQAGDAPGLGDINAGEDLPAYRHVASVLRAVRVPQITEKHYGFDDECARRWLEFFDTPQGISGARP
jgi:hypothetical protein